MNLGSFKTRVFSNEERVAIEKKIAFFVSVLNKLEIKAELDLPKDFNVDLNDVKVSRLRVLVQCGEELKKLSAMSLKIETCSEFINLKHLINEASKKLTAIKIHMNELKSGLTEGYSKYSKSYITEAFDEILPYSNFLKHYESLFIEEDMTKNFLSFYEPEKIFDIIKLNLIVEETNILEYVKLNPDKLINLTELLTTNPKSITLIQKEFFRNLSKEYFEITPQLGKITHSEIVKPSHPLAQKIKIQNNEVGIVTLSLNPINKSKYDVGERFVYNKLPFYIASNQETIKLDLFYQIKIKKEQSINIVLPIYFSIIKAKLNI